MQSVAKAMLTRQMPHLFFKNFEFKSVYIEFLFIFFLNNAARLKLAPENGVKKAQR